MRGEKDEDGEEHVNSLATTQAPPPPTEIPRQIIKLGESTVSTLVDTKQLQAEPQLQIWLPLALRLHEATSKTTKTQTTTSQIIGLSPSSTAKKISTS